MAGYDGYFDMPAGYSDADMETAALTDAGNRWWKRMRRFTEEQRETLRTVGATVEVRCKDRETGERYVALARTVDEDDVGPIVRFSVDNGGSWHTTARGARTAVNG